MIILFGGKEYAVGLTWFSISSPAEVDQFKREMDMTRGVMKVSKEEGQPSAVALAPTEYANQVSLAAAISYAHENLLYVCKTDYKDEAGRPLYYLCCVKRGIVTVDGDTMGDIDTIQSLYAQCLIDLKTDIAEDKIECLGTDVDDERFPGAQPIDAGRMVTSIQRFESQCVIKELKKEGLSKGMIGAVVVLFLGMMYLGYEWLLKPAPPPPTPVTPVVRAPPPVDPFTQLMNSINTQTTITPGGLPMIAQGVRTIPVVLNGWSVTDINVSMGATVTFNLILKRNTYATLDTLNALEKNGTLKNISVDTQGDQATAIWGMDVKDVPLLTKELLTAIQSEKNASFRTQFLTTLQSKPQIKITLESPINVSGFNVQKFSYKDEGIWSIGGFAEIFRDMKTMGILSLHISPKDGNYEWELQGVVYG